MITVYQILREISSNLSLEDLQYLIKIKISSLPVEEFNHHTLKLLKTVTVSAVDHTESKVIYKLSIVCIYFYSWILLDWFLSSYIIKNKKYSGLKIFWKVIQSDGPPNTSFSASTNSSANNSETWTDIRGEAMEKLYKILKLPNAHSRRLSIFLSISCCSPFDNT